MQENKYNDLPVEKLMKTKKQFFDIIKYNNLPVEELLKIGELANSKKVWKAISKKLQPLLGKESGWETTEDFIRIGNKFKNKHVWEIVVKGVTSLLKAKNLIQLVQISDSTENKKIQKCISAELKKR